MAKITTLDFVTKAQVVHGTTYDYTNTVYVRRGGKLVITCPIHGVFSQEAGAHLKGQGCPACGKLKRARSIEAHFTTEYFVKEAVTVHKNTYTYTDTTYISSIQPVVIICSTHGKFTQSPRVHLAGHGCPKCAKANNNYWSYSGWEQAGEKSKYFTGYKVYILKLYNDTEVFYKIGKTYTSVMRRVSRGGIPYKYEVIRLIEGTAIDTCKLEQTLLNMHYSEKYVPTLPFAGAKECFSKLLDIKGYTNES